MQFTSFEFIFFLPIVFVIYFYLSPTRRWALLLLTSYFFYGFHNPAYVILLLISTTIDFITGLRIYETKEKNLKKKWLLLSVFTNLGLLFFFKYYNFFSNELNHLFLFFQLPFHIQNHHLLLPLGISFYTFQTLSYSIDVYRGYLRPETHFGKFALFVCFFPQLVAGPIERARDLLKQFHFNYQFEYKRVIEGLQLILWGFFKKIIVADWLAMYVNEIYDISNGHSGPVIFFATFLFGLQIYFDFSGYCDIAIGIARVLGIKLSQNFGNFIYFTSPKYFWQGWHITISEWFRDYVFFPLSAMRKSNWFYQFSLFLTFVISGIWHGSGWGFILWGVINGLLVIGDYQTKNIRFPFSRTISLSFHYKLFNHSYLLFSLILMVFSTYFFRALNVQDGLILLGKTFDLSTVYINIGIGNFNQVFIFLLLIIVFLFHLDLKKKLIHEYLASKMLWFRWSFYMVLINLILYARPPQSSQFIYFEF